MNDVRDDQNPQQTSRISPRMIVVIVLAVLALIFVIQNSESHRIDMLFWNVSMPLWLWMIILLAVGVVIGSIFPWFRRRKD
jgi:uncharacterized integral membrane protein